MRSVLTHALYPALLVGGLAFTLWISRAGVDQAQAVGFTSAAFGVIIFALQFVHPKFAAWRLRWSDYKLDALHAVFSMGAVTALVKAAGFGMLFAISDALSHAFGSTLWPTSWPLALQVILALVAGELGAYLFHRLCHESWLWRVHALHHSAEDLHLLASGRNHPLSTLVAYASQMTILILLGARGEVLMLQSAFSGINGLLQHANIEMRCGFLNWFFSTPQMHHWHHSRTIVESNTNYGSNVLVWDLVFRSYFNPAGRRPSADVGLPHGTRFPTTFLGHLASPFMWSSIEAPMEDTAAAPSHHFPVPGPPIEASEAPSTAFARSA